jgi:pSer/pThr/pTyr-binding forkhead associated (FHA) protein
MDIFEKVNRAFGEWYENLFGSDGDVRPKDILRLIFSSMESYRKEGLDDRIYVPNQYILEISVDDEEEKEYLLSFLDKSEVEAAIRRYCKQNGYSIRGNLDLTIREKMKGVTTGHHKRLNVLCRYVSNPTHEGMREKQHNIDHLQTEETMSKLDTTLSEPGTISTVFPASLHIYPPGKPPYRFVVSQNPFIIGRSIRLTNHLIVENDGQISRQHCRLERAQDELYTLYDMHTTNGTRVNGKRIQNRVLQDGDEIMIGSTRIIFELSKSGFELNESVSNAKQETSPVKSGWIIDEPHSPARLILIDRGLEVREYPLTADTGIGRGITNHVVLADKSVALRHARITLGDPVTLHIVDHENVTRLNGLEITHSEDAPLHHGDMLEIGDIMLRFEGVKE